uniref:Uncharacterized protein n=1 Tax=Ditylenchus dipsaci TaxID=166011 RepID=A0A915DAK1_9BILA
MVEFRKQRDLITGYGHIEQFQQEVTLITEQVEKSESAKRNASRKECLIFGLKVPLPTVTVAHDMPMPVCDYIIRKDNLHGPVL